MSEFREGMGRGWFAVAVFSIALTNFFAAGVVMNTLVPNTASGIASSWILVSVILLIWLVCKRVLDFGGNAGLHLVLMIIPIANFVNILYLMFKPGRASYDARAKSEKLAKQWEKESREKHGLD